MIKKWCGRKIKSIDYCVSSIKNGHWFGHKTKTPYKNLPKWERGGSNVLWTRDKALAIRTAKKLPCETYLHVRVYGKKGVYVLPWSISED